MENRNYWVFRIDKSRDTFFYEEILKGYLRQGWGWDTRQNLRVREMDSGSFRNIPMFEKVKKGDILLIPSLPHWGYLTLAEATEDWNVGYKFESVDDQAGDFGHMFPVRFIKCFLKSSYKVHGSIKSTLRNPGRFWSITKFKEDVDRILDSNDDELHTPQNHGSRYLASMGQTFKEMFDENTFKENLYQSFISKFQKSDWEYAVVEILQSLYPTYVITREGGIKEKEHGADILIKIPNPLSDYDFGIAVQVKDWDRKVNNPESLFNQINKSDNYWDSESLKLIEKWVILTKASKKDNPHLLDNVSNVKVIFAEDLKELLGKAGKTWIGSQAFE
jgi:hypothetical protein